MPGIPGQDAGKIEGTVTILGEPVERTVIALSYQPFPVAGSDDGNGQEINARQILGVTQSAINGAYSMDLGSFLDEVIVIALDDYGERWQPNTYYPIGARIRPTPGHETGYVYVCTVAGGSFPTEPAWWINTGDNTIGAVGTATFAAHESWWPLAHAPVLPDVILYDGIIIDPYFNENVLLTHADADPADTIVDAQWDNVLLLLSGDPAQAASATDIKDASLRETALTISGNTQLGGILKPFGNGSIHFDGTGDFIKTVSASSEWGMHNSQMTIEAHILTETKADTRYIVTNRDGPNTVNRWACELTSDGRPAMIWWNSANTQGGYKTSSLALTVGQWHHVAWVVDGMNIKIFVDGVQTHSSNMSNKPSLTTARLEIARQDTDTQWDFKGNIANLRVTQAARYAANFTPPTAPYDEEKSTHYNDFNNIMTNSLALDFRRFAKISAPEHAKFGTGALELLDSYIDITSNDTDQLLYFNAANYTIEFHLKPLSLFGNTTIIDSGFAGIANGFRIRNQTGATLEITIGGVVRFTTAALTAGAYAHLALSRVDGTTRFFINGVQQGTSISDPSILLLQKIRLGGSASGGERMQGWVDDLRITKAGRYAANFTPPAAPLPDTKYNLSPGDSAEYAWIPAADLINGDFEQAITVGWSSLVFGTLPASTATKHAGAYGFGQPSSVDAGRRYQTIAVPANTVMAELSGWLIKTDNTTDAAGAFVRFYTAGMAEIKGHGAAIRTTGGTAHASQLKINYCEVPANAAFARVYIGIQAVSGASVLNAGGDDIAVRWLTEAAAYRPPMTSVPFINQDLWMGNLTGWAGAIISGTSGPQLLTGNGDEANYSVQGSANAVSTKLTQTAAIPDGDFTHALIAYSSSNSAAAGNSSGDTDNSYLLLNFKNSSGAIVATTQIHGSCFSGNANGPPQRACAIVALPPTAVEAEADIRFLRENGTVLNAHFSGISVKLFKPAQPLKTALGIA